MNSWLSLLDFTHSRWTDSGIWPPLSALASFPEYSSAVLVSQTNLEGSPTEAKTSSQPAIIDVLGDPLNLYDDALTVGVVVEISP